MQKFRQHLPILLLLSTAFLIGLVTVRQYGESWDELQFFKYADRALEAYSTWPRTGTIPLTGNTYDNYGPAYVMLVALGARLLGLMLPWMTSDIRHLIYLITYLVGIWAFHILAQRWLDKWAAFGATLLFCSQPLFWGHAFISPKDIPFMALFLLSLELGFRMVDHLSGMRIEAPSQASARLRPVLTLAWLVLVYGIYAATPLIQARIHGLVNAAAAGQPNIVTLIASDIGKVDPEVYGQRYFVFFVWLRDIVFIGSAALMAWSWRRIPLARHIVLAVAPAAVLLGVTTAVRVLGPLAGLLVGGYAVWKVRRRAVPALTVYAAIALAAMYLSWPYLWANPLGHLVESVRVMSEYPWKGQVLFDGATYSSAALPGDYLPLLLGIQLTEPVWLLFAGGIGIAVLQSLHCDQASRMLLVLTGAWFVLPLLGFIGTRAPLYDNFRQVFFILPPIFLMAGMVLQRMRQPLIQAALIGLLALPGIVDGVRLHPYEYVYYNRFIGGVHGAFRKFELDYWATSYREAAYYLNEVAPANGTVWVEGPAHLLQLYARPDLKIYSTGEPERADHYDYAVATTRYDLDLSTYPESPVVHTIGREGAAFTVIKKP